MLRRLTVVLAGLVAAGSLATGVAAAAPADHHGRQRQHDRHHQHRLTPREREGLRIAGHVLDVLFGGPSRQDHMY
ncbi:hypothetical protein ACH4YO_21940 [Streptomyces noursei]|uniref:Uncharacterized protein n=2 Tax=Streptomyces TaxID=1883 RepID=A0A9X8QZH6_9ACTN|nr:MULTISPECIES: hypothetical protein [Streptomyces]ANZ14605.1 membrane protein [Streptomyces noursei ATCC 11455]MCZ0992042.1 hypothetical protein [Streptomyces noursei]MCZ1019678.1 hypothetical protein [Streptomyces noursei]PNE37622.1 hypothetical protein AOB60_25430 [Streptomyces noursei]WEB38940.1 hypothetical protein MOV08_06235 [Streptomyces yunnanensis]